MQTMTQRKIAALAIGALLAVASMIGQGVAQTTAAPPASAGAPQDYILGPADVIEVDLLGVSDFTTKQRIDEEGTIRLPMIGQVPAANQTVGQLADSVAAKLKSGGYYAQPIVKIDVVSFGSRYVTVLGNFNQPGLVPMDRLYRLSEVVARVGGIKDSGANYVIYRPHGGGERKISVADLATGDLKDDPYVAPGDKIYSPPADLVFVSGQVKTPGAFAITPGMTIRMALSRGGGVTDQGTESRVTMTREGVKTTHVKLDDTVRAGDVLVVGERLF
jgi:polysaccharide export outer membrane protein